MGAGRGLSNGFVGSYAVGDPVLNNGEGVGSFAGEGTARREKGCWRVGGSRLPFLESEGDVILVAS
jgi:hypothetical protein